MIDLFIRYIFDIFITFNNYLEYNTKENIGFRKFLEDIIFD